jgi:hypothetical protein
MIESVRLLLRQTLSCVLPSEAVPPEIAVVEQVSKGCWAGRNGIATSNNLSARQRRVVA